MRIGEVEVGVIFSVLPVLVYVCLFVPVVSSGWWTVDDSVLLFLSLKYKPFGFFYVPQKWLIISSAHLTPWIELTLYVDYKLFGLEPRWFYVHNLLVLVVLSMLLYVFLSRWFPRLEAVLLTLLVLLAPPVFATFCFIWTRHYTEGLLFLVLSLLFFVKYVELGNKKFLVGSAICYLLATTCKEIFVPVVAFYVLYPRLRLRDRVFFVVPGVLYAVWRFYMLGFGRAFYVDGSFSVLRFLFEFPYAVARAVCVSKALAVFVLACFALALGVLVARNRRYALVSLVWFVILLVPAVPVASGVLSASVSNPVGLRLVFFPSFVFTLAFGFVLFRCRWKFLAVPLVVVLVFLSLYRDVGIVRLLGKRFFAPYKSISEFVLSGGSDKVFVHSFGEVYYFSCLVSMYRYLDLVSDRDVAYYCVDPCLCFDMRPELGGLKAFTYQDGAVREITRRWCQVKSDVPLVFDIRYDGDVVEWKFGPYRTGTYCVVEINGTGDCVYPRRFIPNGMTCGLPPTGKLVFRTPRRMELVLKYVSPEGWVAYSLEPVVLEPPKQ